MAGATTAVANCGKVSGFFAIRVLNPSGSLSNMLTIRGDLSENPGASSQLELVVVAVSDRLLQMSYVEGQEIPVSGMWLGPNSGWPGSTNDPNYAMFCTMRLAQQLFKFTNSGVGVDTVKITLKTVDTRNDDRVLATIIIEASTM